MTDDRKADDCEHVWQPTAATVMAAGGPYNVDSCAECGAKRWVPMFPEGGPTVEIQARG